MLTHQLQGFKCDTAGAFKKVLTYKKSDGKQGGTPLSNGCEQLELVQLLADQSASAESRTYSRTHGAVQLPAGRCKRLPPPHTHADPSLIPYQKVLGVQLPSPHT